MDDIERARRVPSFQLIGDDGLDAVDLNTLQAMGITLTGRLVGVQDGMAQFSGSLANHCALSDLKTARLLGHFDQWAARMDIPDLPEKQHLPPTSVPATPQLMCNLTNGGIRTIVWATCSYP